VKLSHDEDQSLIVISPSTRGAGLRPWKVTTYIYAVSAVGFRTWSGVDWPFGEIAPARISDDGLEITIPAKVETEPSE